MIPQKDRIEAAIHHIQTASDVDPWAMELAVEALKAQNGTDTNVGSNDLISRSDAIDAVDKLSDEPIGYLEAAIDALVDLPSAQPEIIHCCECKYWKPGYITDDDDFVPPGCAVGWVSGYWKATDYCSNAERR